MVLIPVAYLFNILSNATTWLKAAKADGLSFTDSFSKMELWSLKNALLTPVKMAVPANRSLTVRVLPEYLAPINLKTQLLKISKKKFSSMVPSLSIGHNHMAYPFCIKKASLITPWRILWTMIWLMHLFWLVGARTIMEENTGSSEIHMEPNLAWTASYTLREASMI